MTTNAQNWLLGLVLVALLAALAGDLLGARLLVRVAVPTFFLAAASLFALMTVTKLVDAIRSSEPDVHDPTRTD
ncbi:MAG: hypothetical protein R6U01_04565 [Halorubrum sp.]|uniref:hypothetical protein n=1 Tax=Halorubrum sp. TaxID=1879286 RepID=UPI0039708306